jgi:hypothetical protein
MPGDWLGVLVEQSLSLGMCGMKADGDCVHACGVQIVFVIGPCRHRVRRGLPRSQRDPLTDFIRPQHWVEAIRASGLRTAKRNEGDKGDKGDKGA